MAKNGKLSDSELATEVQSVVVDASTVVNHYVTFVLVQKDMKLTVLENLPAHQQLAKGHAKFWRDNVQPNIKETLTDTVNFSTAFLAKYDALKVLIDKMKTGDATAKEEFADVLKILMSALDKVIENNRSTLANLVQFNSMLSQDVRNFTQDSEEAQVKIIGDNKDKQAIQNALDAIQKAINRDIGLIAGGIFFGWLAVWGGIDLKKQKDRQKTEEAKLASENQELMALNTVKGQINGFVNSIPSVLSALTNLQGSWASLKSDFEEVIEELKKMSNTDAATFLGGILETAKKDWNVAQDEAKKLQPHFTAVSLALDDAIIN